MDVKRETIDGEALKAFNVESFDEDNPPDYVAASERLYKAFGLMEPDQSLRQLFLDLIDSQVAGFYKPDDKALYVVSRTGSITGADKITFAHEYDHALQDASFTVFADQKDLLDETDRALARAAVYEGDATLLMVLWAGGNLTPEEFAEVQAAGADPESMAVLARTPAILVESLLFPYTAGQAFILPVQTAGGWDAVNALYDDLPRSTEQILHPDKYRAGEEPVAVKLPANARDRDGRRLDRVDAGHVRRIPDRRVAARIGDHRQRCVRRGRRLGWRSPGRARWSGRGLGGGDALDLGHGRGRDGLPTSGRRRRHDRAAPRHRHRRRP